MYVLYVANIDLRFHFYDQSFFLKKTSLNLNSIFRFDFTPMVPVGESEQT